MSRTQRFVLLGVAAVVAVLAIVVLPGDDKNDDPTPAGTAQQPAGSTQAQTIPATTDATPPLAPKPRPHPKSPLLRAGAKRELQFTRGETVRFRVRHPSAEEVHVHGYDISKELPAGKTVTVTFQARIEGIFEVELEHSHTPLAKLTVEPK